MARVHPAPKIALFAGFATLLAAACAPAAPRAEAPPTRREPARPVDMTCVERAQEGTLLASLPRTVDGFNVEIRGEVVSVSRPGRSLSDAEGNALWRLFSEEYFPKGGLAGGSNGLGSVYTCPKSGKAGCFHLQLWACQTSVEALVPWMREAAERVGAGDAEIDMELDVLERNGPPCTEDCEPSVHYSRKNDKYDPNGERHASKIRGGGACSDDADCVGAESNSCSAWYLRGGGELAIYIQVSEPTFCGCVQGECSWFTQ